MPSPNYRSSQTIPRRFSDAELAIDDRVDSLLQEDPVELVRGNSIGQTLHWLKEDLALRGTLRKNLAEEQELAFNQSARRELHEQAVKNDRDDEQALDAMKEVDERIRNGEDASTAIHNVTKSRDGLALNQRWGEVAKERQALYESDSTREIRAMEDKVKSLKLGTEAFNLQVFEDWRQQNPEEADRMIRVLNEKAQTEEITAANAKLAADLQRINMQNDLKEAQDRASNWTKLSAGLTGDPDKDGPALDRIAELKDSFDEVGLGDVRKPQNVVRQFSGSQGVLGMLASKQFLNENLKTPEEKAAFADALNIATSENPTVTMEAKDEAMDYVLRLGGKYIRETRQAQLDRERSEAAMELAKDGNSIFRDISKRIDDAVSGSNLPKNANANDKTLAKQTQKRQILGAGLDYLSTLRNVTPEMGKEFDQAIDRMNKLDSGEKVGPGTYANAVREVMADITVARRRLISRVTREKTSESGNGKDQSAAVTGDKIPADEDFERWKKASGGDLEKAKQLARDEGFKVD